MSDTKTYPCECGKDIVFYEGSLLTKLCNICPLKLRDFYFVPKDQHYYTQIKAKQEEEAKKLFSREFPNIKYNLYTNKPGHEGIKKKGKTLEVKYEQNPRLKKNPKR